MPLDKGMYGGGSGAFCRLDGLGLYRGEEITSSYDGGLSDAKFTGLFGAVGGFME